MLAWKPTPFIFIHIPRCGGTSVEEALIPRTTLAQSWPELSRVERLRHWLHGSRGRQHSKLLELARYHRLGEYFKFAFVRNPWARAVSQIEFLRAGSARTLFPGRTFKENLRLYCASKRVRFGHDLAACQFDYLQDNQGGLCMDFVGRFESLERDFRKACRIIGLRPVPVLPHTNNSRRRRHYSAYYDEESAEWIRERFAKDIEYFGYKFKRET